MKNTQKGYNRLKTMILLELDGFVDYLSLMSNFGMTAVEANETLEWLYVNGELKKETHTVYYKED